MLWESDGLGLGKSMRQRWRILRHEALNSLAAVVVSFARSNPGKDTWMVSNEMLFYN